MRSCTFLILLAIVSCSTRDRAVNNFLNTLNELQLPTTTTEIENLEVTDIDTTMVRKLKIFGHDRPFDVDGENMYEVWFAYGKITQPGWTAILYGYSSTSDVYIRLATFVDGERKDDITLMEAVPSVGEGMSPNYATLDEGYNLTIHYSVFEGSLQPSAVAFISYRINAKGSIMETGRNIAEFHPDTEDEYIDELDGGESPADGSVLTRVNLPVLYTEEDLVLEGTPLEIRKKQVLDQENSKSSRYESYIPFMMTTIQPEILQRDFDDDARKVYGVAAIADNDDFYTNLYFVNDDNNTSYHLVSVSKKTEAIFKLKLFDNSFFKSSETQQASLQIDKQLVVTLELWNGTKRINQQYRIEKNGNMVAR